MTQPTRPTGDRAFARDVAKQIDRRRVRRRLTLWSALLGLVAAAAFYLRCGSGFGLGGPGGFGDPGDGGDDAAAPRAAAAPSRCTIRVSPRGITIAGKAKSRDEAVAACKAALGVDIYPTGDVRHGDPQELGAALERAGAKNVLIHDPPRPPESGAPRN
jgi:hypothetical protein